MRESVQLLLQKKGHLCLLIESYQRTLKTKHPTRSKEYIVCEHQRVAKVFEGQYIQ